MSSMNRLRSLAAGALFLAADCCDAMSKRLLRLSVLIPVSRSNPNEGC